MGRETAHKQIKTNNEIFLSSMFLLNLNVNLKSFTIISINRYNLFNEAKQIVFKTAYTPHIHKHNIDLCVHHCVCVGGGVIISIHVVLFVIYKI